MSTSTTTTTRTRAIALLGQGVPPTAVASALGVDPSAISQYLSEDDFAAAVVEAKFQALAKHNERDTEIDSLEDRLLEKLKDCLPFMTRPMEILKAFSVLNAAKRKGQAATGDLQGKQTIIQLNIPQIVLDKFTSNVHNQVVQVGAQTLLTIPSGQMLKSLEARNAALTIENDTSTTSPPAQTVSS